MSRFCLHFTATLATALLGSLVAVVHQIPTNDRYRAEGSTPLPSPSAKFMDAFETPTPLQLSHDPYIVVKDEDPFAWSNIHEHVPMWLAIVPVLFAPKIVFYVAKKTLSTVLRGMDWAYTAIIKFCAVAQWLFALDSAQIIIDLLTYFKWSTYKNLSTIVIRMETLTYSSIFCALICCELIYPGQIWFSWRDAFCWPAILYALFFRPYQCVPLLVDPLAGVFFFIGHVRREHVAVSPLLAALAVAGWWTMTTCAKLLARRTTATRTASPVNKERVIPVQ